VETRGGLAPGPKNSMTDVPGVRVGHVTLIEGDAVRTGVTAVIPGDDVYPLKYPAGAHVINGFGKMTGLAQVQELGRLETPIVLTNTFSVWQAGDGILDYVLRRAAARRVPVHSCNPVVGECNDSRLNDMAGRHVRASHVVDALDTATDAAVPQGAVGAGTGMVCYGFKGGIGSASRRWTAAGASITLGVLVLANFGRREELVVRGCPVGRLLGGPGAALDPADRKRTDEGSVIVLMATDAALSARQLTRVARRAAAGLARTGTPGNHGSGDFALAFSTARSAPPYEPDEGERLNPFFAAAADATEDAVIHALLQARPMTGRGGFRVEALTAADLRRAREIWARRLAEA
jgi:D-aminopeptidase